MNLINPVLVFKKTSEKYNLASVMAVVGIIAIMVKVAVVGEIDSTRPVWTHRPEIEGRSSIRPVGGEDNLGSIGAVGRIIIIN